MSDSRVSAGILLAATGIGGEDLHPFAQANFPFMYPSFRELTTPTLVVAGDHDQSGCPAAAPTGSRTHTVSAPVPPTCSLCTTPSTPWAGSPDTRSPRLPTKNPERVALLQRMSTAYLRTALDLDTDAWAAARAALANTTNPIGHVDSK